MALHWDIRDIKNIDKKRKNLAFDNAIDPMIYMTMAIGINEITEENAEEVYIRISMLEVAKGFFYCYDKDQLPKYPDLAKHSEKALTIGDKVSSFSQEIISQMVGLHTNASRLSRAEFARTLWPEEKPKKKAVKAGVLAEA